MKNHLHLIATSDKLSEEIRKFKSFTARSIIDFYKKENDSKILKKLRGSYTVQRSKGLGENTGEMMWDTTLNPENRKLVQVSMDNIEDIMADMDVFMGDDINGRKKFIEEHGHKYIDYSEVM